MIISKENYKNRKQIILEHIKKYGNISTLEGYRIKTVMEHNRNKTKRYARYYLKEGEANGIL